MNEDQRIKAVFRGERPDQIPWIARIVLWYNYHKSMGTLPERYRDWHMWDIQRDLGMGILARVYVYEMSIEGVEEVITEKDGQTITEYRTPYGTVRTVHIDAPEQAHASASKYQVEKFIKREADYDAMRYILDHTVVRPKYEEYEATEKAVRGDGLVLPLMIRSPWQRILIEFAGYEQAFYDLIDHPAKVEALHDAIYAFYKEKLWPVMLECPGPYIESNDNFSALVTSPKMFERYCARYFREWGGLLHAKGKLLGTHIDGEPAPLLPLLHGANIDVAEAFTPAPMTSITTAEARALAPETIIWGGIPSAILSPASMGDDEFEQYIVDLLQSMAGDGKFILGVGDNVMPEADIERVRKVRALLEKHGRP